MRKCKLCLLPEIVPNANIDNIGVCSYCWSYQLRDHSADETRRKMFEVDLEKTLRNCKGTGQYDCLVSFSGGKDSIYLLHKLKNNYGLRILAFTCDLDIPKVGWDNIKRTIEKLNIDHIIFKPPMEFYRKFFRFLLRNQDARGAVQTVCYISAPLTEGYALKIATEKNIPLIVAGYSPGQPEPDWMLYEMKRDKICEQDWTPKVLTESGLFSQNELDYFWNPKKIKTGTQFPRYLAPFHAWEYNQAEVMQEVVNLGLVAKRKNANPLYSNSPFQWLLMYSDLKNLGYMSYAPEFCSLIRSGRANKNFWKYGFPIVDFMLNHQVFLGKYVTQTARWLDIKLDEMVIRRPAPDIGKTLISKPNLPTIKINNSITT